MHGGASSGPRTVEGLARSRRARWKHGLYSAESLAEQKLARELLAQSRELLKQMQAQPVSLGGCRDRTEDFGNRSGEFA